MPTRIRRLRPALLAIGLATGCLGGPAEGVVDDCLGQPNAPSPPGQHWYYRLDRTTHRECWYLGVAGAKLHQRAQQTPSPERPSAPKPVAKPVPQPRAVAAATEPASNEVVEEEAPAAPAAPDEAAASALPTHWSSLPAAAAPVVPEPGSMGSGYAAEQPASETETEDEMPLVWPILSPAERAAVTQPDASMTSFAQLAAALAMVLGLVALIARVVFRFSAARKRMPVKAPEQRSATARREKTRRPPQPARPPRNAASDMEANVRGLLHELQQRQHDDRDFRRVSRQVA